MSIAARAETRQRLITILTTMNRFVLVLAIMMAGLMTVAPRAGAADLAASKATVDRAKAQGIIGEQADGYLGLVTGTAGSDVVAAMQAINAGRSEAYAQTSQKTGVTPQAAGQATAIQLFEKVPAGQYVRPAGSAWIKK